LRKCSPAAQIRKKGLEFGRGSRGRDRSSRSVRGEFRSCPPIVFFELRTTLLACKDLYQKAPAFAQRPMRWWIELWAGETTVGDDAEIIGSILMPRDGNTLVT
jgi:hypothetical protein